MAQYRRVQSTMEGYSELWKAHIQDPNYYSYGIIRRSLYRDAILLMDHG
jgi:hypothetical protein